ncbi:MAG: hypothetical protein EPO00_07320, partial [Chloroflexota bacterium]
MSELQHPASPGPAVLAAPPSGGPAAGSAHTVFPPIAQFARSEPDPHRRRMPWRRYLTIARRDPQLLLAGFVAFPVVAIELIVNDPSALQVLAVGGSFFLIQAVLTGTRARSWSAVRLAFSLAFVVAANTQA